MIAPCELWGGKAIRNDNEVEAKVPPRKKIETLAISSISAAAIWVLAGIHFSDNKEHLRELCKEKYV